MALPVNTGTNTGPKHTNRLRILPPPFVKTFASPGIDSKQEEFGVIASAAGTPDPSAKGFKVWPWDWSNDAPEQGQTSGKFIGNIEATRTPSAKSIAIRRRGASPWGGKFAGLHHPHTMEHTGGNADLNPGADYKIAGGKGQASSMVRVMYVPATATDRGMKLPTLPMAVQRAGTAPIPAGGNFDGSPMPPLMPRISGWSTIFSWRQRGTGGVHEPART